MLLLWFLAGFATCFFVKVARHPDFTRPGSQELASLCVRGQVHQVVEALQKPELVKFASQPLDAAGRPRDVDDL